MGCPFGGIALEEGLSKLSEQVQNYYGALVEVRNNVRREPIPDKPLALVYTQQIRDTGRLLMDGGLMDQPYIFMQEFKTCIDLMTVFEPMLSPSPKKKDSE